MLLRLVIAGFVFGLLAPLVQAVDSLSAPASTDAFEGVWLGEIVAPNQHATFGLAFTRTPKGFLVSVYFPEMFLYSANFGPADIRDGVFHFLPLGLQLSRKGDALVGTFAPSKLPVELHRGGAFEVQPPIPTFPAAPKVAWQKSLGAGGWAAPIAREGVVYVGTVDGHFHAVRADTGDDVWLWIGDSPIYGSAVASSDHVFFLNDRGELVALRRSNGALEWKVALSTSPTPELQKNPTFNHRAAAPVLDAKGTIIYVGSFDGGISAVKASNGRVLWRYEAKAPIYATLGVYGAQLVAGCFDGSVVVLDRTSRKEILRAKVPGAVVSTPVLAAGRWIVGARDYMLYGLDEKRGTIAWRDSYWFSWVESTPSVMDNVAYVGGSDFRRVSAIEPHTGKMIWSTDVHGLTWGTPLATSTTLYAATAGQTLEGTVIQHQGGLVAVDRKTGAIEWRYSADHYARDGFTGFAGSLTLEAGKIIGLAVDGTLIALPAGR